MCCHGLLIGLVSGLTYFDSVFFFLFYFSCVFFKYFQRLIFSL